MAPLEGGGGRLGPTRFDLNLKVGMLFRARPRSRASHGPLQPTKAVLGSTSLAILRGPALSAEILLVCAMRRRRGVEGPTVTAKAKAVLAKHRQASAVYLDGLGVMRSESVRQMTQQKYRIQDGEFFAGVSRKNLKAETQDELEVAWAVKSGLAPLFDVRQ